ncbi:MAG: hypothetical protein MEQ07_10815 [Aquimonas sp.]|nr:hypothetical protein [Aquimonas sp.]
MDARALNLIRQHPILTAVLSLLFAWGVLCTLVAIHFTIRAFTETDNPKHNELAIGVSVALVYGWPAWLGLSIGSVMAFRASRAVAAILALPVVIAGVAFPYFYLFG